jgi:RimJ/RimL family protein N-acetyltransferase
MKFIRKSTQNYLETERLIIRNWEAEDIIPFVELNENKEVMKYFLKPLNKEESFDLYFKIQNEYAKNGFSPYVVELKKDRAFVGFAGFNEILLDLDFKGKIEIGWRFFPQFWNKNFATEAASACLEYAKNYLNLDEIFAFTSLLNKASERVMQKIGMTKVKEFGHPLVAKNHKLHQHILYKINLKSYNFL